MVGMLPDLMHSPSHCLSIFILMMSKISEVIFNHEDYCHIKSSNDLQSLKNRPNQPQIYLFLRHFIYELILCLCVS